MKRCTKCKEDKSLSEFRRDASSKDGFYSNCKACESQYKTSARGKERGRLCSKRRIVQRAEYHKAWRKTPAGEAWTQRKRQRERNFSYSEPYNRYIIWQEWQQKCIICDQHIAFTEMTIDHIIPAARGGNDVSGNVGPAHRGCNSKKQHRIDKYINVKLKERIPYVEFIPLAV